MSCRSGFSPTLLPARIVGLKPDLQANDPASKQAEDDCVEAGQRTTASKQAKDSKASVRVEPKAA
jgi:hypothetical protein